MPQVSPSLESEPQDTTRLVLTIGATIAALYFGSEIFVPIALAILLSFVLAPGVRLLHAWHLGRVVPVLVMTLLAFIAIVALSGLITTQVKELATELPKYESTMMKKVEALRQITTGGTLQRVINFASNLSQTVDQNRKTAQASPETYGASGPQPMTVVVRQPEPTPLETLGRILAPLIHPLATTGIVVVFVIFILLQRDDLRNRMIRLFGAGDLHRSTAAIDDAAHRLSRLLLSQLAVNTGAGLVVGLALWVVGVPSPILWGVLFGCLRFVPYVGPPLAAVMPVVLAASVDPGWSITLWTLAVFVVTEALVGQVVEPFLYGHNTGLSPVAVVLAATFWTALWGPIGLILSTPMTVCLVVLGRHVEQLNFLDVLLGDRPPLSPPEVFYQRMLANDPVEASDQAHQLLRTMSLTEYCDSVVLPGLLLAQDDVAQERLDADRQRRIAEATAEMMEDLAEADGEADAKPSESSMNPHAIIDKITHAGQAHEQKTLLEKAPEPLLAPEWRNDHVVLCVGSRGPLDDAAAMLLAHLLVKHEFGAASASYETLLKANIDRLDLSRSRLICLSCLGGSSSAYLRFVIRRLRRRSPSAKILIGAWWRSVEGQSDPQGDMIGEASAATLSEAVAFCIGQASAETPEEGERQDKVPVLPPTS